MSDQSLRDALEKLVEQKRAKVEGTHVVPVTILERLLAAHPAEPAPVVTDEAVEVAARSQYEQFSARVSWDNLSATAKDMWCVGSRRALEAATPLLGPRPLLDREAVGEILVRWLYPVGSFPQVIDAVMELARPMPTSDEIAYALFEHDSETTGRATPWGELGQIMKATYLDRGAAVLALLNGAEA